MLGRPGHFVYGTKETLLVEFARLHLPEVELAVATRDAVYAGSVILGRRSPLTPVINAGIQRLRQTGTFDVILSKWMREEKASFSSSEAHAPLAGSQVGLAFVLYGAVCGACVVILAAEACWGRYKEEVVCCCIKLFVVVVRGRKVSPVQSPPSNT